jgi:hypothetical protein
VIHNRYVYDVAKDYHKLENIYLLEEFFDQKNCKSICYSRRSYEIISTEYLLAKAFNVVV